MKFLKNLLISVLMFMSVGLTAQEAGKYEITNMKITTISGAVIVEQIVDNGYFDIDKKKRQVRLYIAESELMYGEEKREFKILRIVDENTIQIKYKTAKYTATWNANAGTLTAKGPAFSAIYSITFKETL